MADHTTSLAASHLAGAQARLADAKPHTRDANDALSDVAHFGTDIRRGALAAYPGEIETALSLGGLARITWQNETTDQLRAAIRAYGQWLIDVADKAL